MIYDRLDIPLWQKKQTGKHEKTWGRRGKSASVVIRVKRIDTQFRKDHGNVLSPGRVDTHGLFQGMIQWLQRATKHHLPRVMREE
jgi:hypothetical protein